MAGAPCRRRRLPGHGVHAPGRRRGDQAGLAAQSAVRCLAGGREPSHWEAYPGHAYLHTIGYLPCCDRDGYWKSRVRPLGDGALKDSRLCRLPVLTSGGGWLPQCMDMITAGNEMQPCSRGNCRIR